MTMERLQGTWLSGSIKTIFCNILTVWKKRGSIQRHRKVSRDEMLKVDYNLYC